MMPKRASLADEGGTLREKILETASDLFYRMGVRAVGVDLVVEKAGVAKTSLYRHFRTKDDLIAAFLAREDLDFWRTWDRTAAEHAKDAKAELDAQLGWIGERAGRPDYRGCPQINVAAEFAETDHPARKVAKAHKRELRRRLKVLAERLNVPDPDEVAGQLAVLINGAFVSTQLFEPGEATPLLRHAADALINGNVSAAVRKRKAR
jgi:AcrR family transcriptional regulator